MFLGLLDPDPYPLRKRYRSGSFYHQAKIVRKTLIHTALRLFFYFLSLKNDVNVPLKTYKQKTIFISFLLACWRLMTKIAGYGTASGSGSGSESGSESLLQQCRVLWQLLQQEVDQVKYFTHLILGRYVNTAFRIFFTYTFKSYLRYSTWQLLLREDKTGLLIIASLFHHR